MQKLPDFIAIDDNPIDNMINLKIIKLIAPEAQAKSFTDPEKGLEYIEEACEKSTPKKMVLLLDINMPVLSGWEVLDRLAARGKRILDSVKIYIMSSSIDPTDINKARQSPLVTEFIRKPFSKAAFLEILAEVAN